MSRLLFQLAYAQSHPEKMRILRHHSMGNPVKISELITFIRLPTDIFQTICTFKSRDWLSYGAMKEYEYGFNREPEDFPKENQHEKDWSDLLTKDLFEKVKSKNPSILLTHELYVMMRTEEEWEKMLNKLDEMKDNE